MSQTTRRFTNPPHPLDQDQPIQLSSCVNFDVLLLFFLTELARLLASTSLPQTFLSSSLPVLLLLIYGIFDLHPFWASSFPWQVLQFTPKTFVPALLHQLSRTSSPIHTEDFRSSAAPPTVKDKFSNSHRRLSSALNQLSSAAPALLQPTQGQDLQFTPKTFVPALLHQLSKTGSPIHTEDFRSSAAPPTVKDRFSNSHRRLSFQRCSTNFQGQDLQFTPKTFVPALLHQLSRTGSPIHTEDFRPALLHQLSRTGSPIHTEDFLSNADFRSSAASPTVKDRISNSHRRLPCSTNCQRQDLHSHRSCSSAAPPTVKDRFSNSHRRLSFQRCSTNCQGQVLQFTPKTFVPALLHQLSRTGRLFSAAPPTVKDKFSNSHRRLFQRCSTNCQGQDLQFTPKTFAPVLLHQLLKGVLQFTPKTFVPALLHQLSRTSSPIHTEDFRSSAAPPTVKDRFSNSHRRLSFQRCSTNCQGQDLQFTPKRCSSNCQGLDLQFTPKTFVPALLHQLSRTSSPIHTEDFRSSAAHQLSRTSSPIHTEDFRSRAATPTVKDRFSNSHRKLSFQRCSRTGSPPTAPPTVKDKISNSHRRLSTFSSAAPPTVKESPIHTETFVPALLHQLSKTGSPIHTEDFRSCCSTTVKDKFSNSHRKGSSAAPPTVQGRDLQFTPKTFVPALLHQLSRTGSPIHTEDFRSSAAPPTVKDRFSNSHRRLSFQRCSTNCQRQVLQFTPKTFVPALLHQLSRTGSPIHTEDFRSSAAPPTVKDRFSNSHRKLSFQRCSTNCQGQVLQFTPQTFVPALLQPTVKDRFSNSHRRLSFQRCSTNCQHWRVCAVLQP